MRKHIFGTQFGRDTNERKALFKTLASSLVLEERISTTLAKAKAIRPYVEKLVTKARKGETAFRLIEPYLTKEAALKMIEQVSPRFSGRQGGYTRIVFAGNRIADNAPVAIIEFTQKGQTLPGTTKRTLPEKQTVAKTLAKTARKEKKK